MSQIPVRVNDGVESMLGRFAEGSSRIVNLPLEVKIHAKINKRGKVVRRKPVFYGVAVNSKGVVTSFPFSSNETDMIARLQPRSYQSRNVGWTLEESKHVGYDYSVPYVILTYRRINI